jgi:predicted DNA-binding protein with PD1-like motif
VPRRSKPIKGQVSLIGEIHDFSIKYFPRKVVSDTGEAVIVLRLPEGAELVDKLASLDAMRKMARETRSAPNRFFYMKRPRR